MRAVAALRVVPDIPAADPLDEADGGLPGFLDGLVEVVGLQIVAAAEARHLVASCAEHADDEDCQRAGRAIREATLEAVAEGIRTADLSGHHGTTAFADEVVRRTRTKLEVWAAL